jgi:hypothetical protein
LVVLGPLLGKADWQTVLQPLKDADIKAMKDLCEKETEGRRTLSWIWKTPGVASGIGADGDEDLHDCKHSFYSVATRKWAYVLAITSSTY